MKGHKLFLNVLSLGLLLALAASLNAGAPRAARAHRSSASSDVGSYGGLAVGVPDEDLSGTDEGYVNVVYGSSSGLTSTGSHGLQQGPGDLGNLPGWPEDYDYFGSALAILAAPEHSIYLPVVLKSYP